MKKEDILDTAKELIAGQRAIDYGDAQDNFRCIAESWSWWLSEKTCSPITSDDVAMMMVLLKMARLRSNRLHTDSYCDLVGYAALAGEIALGHGVQEEVEK